METPAIELTSPPENPSSAERAALERRHGRPVDEASAAMGRLYTALVDSRRETTTAERRLLAAGPAGCDERRLGRMLGRRDELAPAQQREYDTLAGRIAVDEVLREAPGRGRAERWHRIGSGDVGGDVKDWVDRLSNRSERGAEDGRELDDERGPGR